MQSAEESLGSGDIASALEHAEEAKKFDPDSAALQELLMRPLASDHALMDQARKELEKRRSEAAAAEAEQYAAVEFATARQREKEAGALGSTLSGYLVMVEAANEYQTATTKANYAKRQIENQQQTPAAPISAMPSDARDDNHLRQTARKDAEAAIQTAIRTGSTRDFLVTAAPARIELWEAASNAGIPEASWLVGCCFENGMGVRAADLQKAFQYYLRAAEANYGPAVNDVGLCYFKGRGTTKDLRKAVSYFRRAAELGRASAWYNLGACHLEGLGGLSKNRDEAIRCYRKARELGYQPAEKVLRAMGY